MPPRGLATLWVGKRPVCAAGLFGPSSHLEHRELSCSGRAHCVRWVARLYQKTSLVPYRWVTQASATGLPEAFTCPASLDRPGRLDFEARWLLFLHPFFGPVLCLGVTSHHLHHRGDAQETTTPENRTTVRPENRGCLVGVSAVE